ncbi:glycerol kinase GlpK [Halobacteriovorax sp. GB3]|uniref:glycerol kinase GlpK n=1 Tax=Halobacteriovorax sp. GB3 TaxID=2719615 RepID=UPI00235EE888|nr:glycerol kinase GlpK [Halobacteriovorax sp. GB3]MDD0854754.1 glycerol kinase GlpK [Halobacteriovorax sp. GB3]
MNYILSIDQGTTGTTALLINTQTFAIDHKVNFEFPQHYPKPGWVEHDLDDIWHSVQMSVKEVLSSSNVDANHIKCIGITNQRETTCAFDLNGTPLAKAIVWQDRRTSKFCQSLKDDGVEELFKSKTGLPLDPYFSGTKIHWLLNNNQLVKKHSEVKKLRFGTIDTYLLYKLSGQSSFKTDATNASRTLLMDLETGDWDSELLNILGVDQSTLPEICDSFTDYGTTKGLQFLPDGIPITCLLGDQQAALFGQAGVKKGDMKCTYGTGAFLLLNTGEDIVHSENGLLTTCAYKHNEQMYYALEGSSYIAGAAVQWVRDNLGFIDTSPAIEELARTIKNLEEMENVLFLPFFSGLGSPYWKPDAKGALIGLTRDTGRSHIARACLEGICLSINDIIKAFEQDSNTKLNSLKVDGGAVANNLLLEMQSTFSNLNIIRPEVIETTAFGAGLGAYIGSGAVKLDEVMNLWKEDKTFSPLKEKDYFYKKTELWNHVIKKLYL